MVFCCRFLVGLDMNIIVYTTTTCPFCNMLISYLKERGLSFSEKKVDQDKSAEVEMAQASGGFLGVPFTVIEKEGNRQTIVGFDKNKLDMILGAS